MDNKRKRVVVTGGLGFIGQNLVPILAKEGYFPLVIDFLDPSGIKSGAEVSRRSCEFISGAE